MLSTIATFYRRFWNNDMKKVRIWTPESETDSKVVKNIANKIIRFYAHEENLIVTSAGKNTYNGVAQKQDGLLKAVTTYLKDDDWVIFLLDYDGTQSNFQRRNEVNSHINKITSVIQQLPEKTMLLYIYNEIESWLLVDCLGICCYFKNDITIRQDKNWIKFAQKFQCGETSFIVEPERGGKNAKEYLRRFSHKIISKINPNLKPKDIDKKEYTEVMADSIAEFISINEQTINHNESLKQFADHLDAIAKVPEEE